jgi:ATP-dependent Clp protease ATP-binding subunit ClpA
MYPFERFTEKAKRVLTLAQDEAEKSHSFYIGTGHLLLGILREGDGLAARVLANLGVEIGKVRSDVESMLGRNERVIVQQTIPTSRVKKVIEIAFEEAKRMNDAGVGTEHLLLGLLIEGEGTAAHVLEDLGASLGNVRAQIGKLRREGSWEGEGPGPSSFWTGHRRPAGPRSMAPGGVVASLLRAESLPHLTAEAGSAPALAEVECLHLGAIALGTEHLLLGMLRQGSGRGASALAQAGVALGRAHDEVGTGRKGGERPLVLSWAPEAESALAEAAAAAQGRPVDTGLILAACAGDRAGAGAVLRRLGAEPEAVRAWLAQDGSGEIPPPE